MKRKGLYFLAAGCTGLSLLASTGFTALWFIMSRLPYNETGRYYDGKVVWHEQAVLVYATLSLASMLTLALCAIITWRLRRAASGKP